MGLNLISSHIFLKKQANGSFNSISTISVVWPHSTVGMKNVTWLVLLSVLKLRWKICKKWDIVHVLSQDRETFCHTVGETDKTIKQQHIYIIYCWSDKTFIIAKTKQQISWTLLFHFLCAMQESFTADWPSLIKHPCLAYLPIGAIIFTPLCSHRHESYLLTTSPPLTHLFLSTLRQCCRRGRFRG